MPSGCRWFNTADRFDICIDTDVICEAHAVPFTAPHFPCSSQSLCLRAVRAADHSGDQIENLMPSDRPQLTLELTRCMPF